MNPTTKAIWRAKYCGRVDGTECQAEGWLACVADREQSVYVTSGRDFVWSRTVTAVLNTVSNSSRLKTGSSPKPPFESFTYDSLQTRWFALDTSEHTHACRRVTR